MEEARRRKEDEVEEWQHRVSLQARDLVGAHGQKAARARLLGGVASLGMFCDALPVPVGLLRPESL